MTKFTKYIFAKKLNIYWFLYLIFLLTSCVNTHNLTYSYLSKKYMTKDSSTEVYYAHNENLGLDIPFANIDSVYGNKKKAWVLISISKPTTKICCIYSCKEIGGNKKGYILNKRLGCLDKNNRVKIKAKYTNNNIKFISIQEEDKNKSLLYQIENISK